MKIIIFFSLIVLPAITFSQAKLTPEMLLQLGRVNPVGISKDQKYVVYSVSIPDISENKNTTKTYRIPVAGGAAQEINNADTLVNNDHISPDGKWKIYDSDVKIMNVYGKDFYPDLTKSNVQIYNSLMYRHWDTWEDGKFSHIILSRINDTTKTDLMANEPYDCPQKPFGGDEDYLWNPDGKHVLYVTK
ncbi:MAG: S9 family peptidase, partial [Parafilimonas sp.]